MPRMQHIDCIEIVDHVASNTLADQGQTVLSNNVDTLANRQGLEPPYFLVEKVDKWYPKGVFHPDKTLFNWFISQGLSEDEAQNLVPHAERALFDLCGTFGRSAANESSGEPVARKAEVALPETAPELYQGKRSGEDIAEFLLRVWKPWIDAGVLTRHNLKALDKKAYNAVVNWTSKMPLPSDVALPTRTDTINAEFNIGALSRDEMVVKMRESERLASAIRRRLDLM